MIERAKKILASLSVILVAVGLIVYLGSVLLTEWGAPTWLQLPWSQFEDFAQAKDGSVYVSVRFYQRVLRYDTSGRFLASYPAPGAGYADLATDLNGRIHVRIANSVHTLDADWKPISQGECPFYGNRTWILSNRGDAECASDKEVAELPDREVSPGELLFSSRRPFGRTHFDCQDGTSLYRKGDRVIRYSSDGRVLATYGTPLYLWWAKFPVPLAAAWVVMILYGIFENQRIRRILLRFVRRKPD